MIDIAEFLNIHETYLGQIERGTIIPSVDTAIALANYFEMDFKILLSSFHEEYSNAIFLRQKIFNIVWKLNANEKKFIYKSLLLWIYDEAFHT